MEGPRTPPTGTRHGWRDRPPPSRPRGRGERTAVPPRFRRRPPEVPRAALPKSRELLDRFGGRAWLRAVRSAPAGTWQPLATLTHRQRELLTLAFRLGYYDTPARGSLSRLGDLVGISRAALSKHLRLAERKLLATALGSGGG